MTRKEKINIIEHITCVGWRDIAEFLDIDATESDIDQFLNDCRDCLEGAVEVEEL